MTLSFGDDGLRGDVDDLDPQVDLDEPVDDREAEDDTRALGFGPNVAERKKTDRSYSVTTLITARRTIITMKARITTPTTTPMATSPADASSADPFMTSVCHFAPGASWRTVSIGETPAKGSGMSTGTVTPLST